MRIVMRTFVVLLVFVFRIAVSGPLNAQSIGSQSASTSLPDAPLPNGQVQPQFGPTVGLQSPNRAYGPLAPFVTRHRLTVEQKWRIYTYRTFGPPAVVLPAFTAAIRMARPPDNYPSQWVDGVGAFGRQYGNVEAVQTSKRTAALLAELAFHEDPRYLPAKPGTKVVGRFTHAIVFTLFDQSDSGRRTLALSHFAGAAAGGFVGNAYLPDGFNTVSRAGQRATIELGDIGITNLVEEFRIVQKFHLPAILPAWWVPEHSHHP